MNSENPKFAINHHSLEEQFQTLEEIISAITSFINCLQHLETRLHAERPHLLYEKNQFADRSFKKNTSAAEVIGNLPKKYQQLWYIYTKNSTKSFGNQWDLTLEVSKSDYLFPTDYKERIFISFKGHDCFKDINIEASEKPGNTKATIINAIEENELKLHLPAYEPNDKKHHVNSRGNASKMPLSVCMAQTVLNFSVPVGKQRYGCYRGTIYEFQPHRPEENKFHGYILEEHAPKLNATQVEYILKNCDPLYVTN